MRSSEFLVPRPVTEMVFSDLFRFLMALPNKPSPMMKPNEATAMAIMFFVHKIVILGDDLIILNLRKIIHQIQFHTTLIF